MIRLRYILFSAIMLMVLVCSVAGFYCYNILNRNEVFALTNDDILKIINNKIEQNTFVYDSQGQKIGEFFSNYSIQLKYNNYPPFLVKAIIATEDRKFFSHSGLDLKAIIRALKDTISSNKVRQGASTITQQIVKNLILTHKKTIERKIIEAYLSLKLETMFSKEELFEFYANNMFLGNGSYGVAAASKRYFNQDLSSLAPEQFALIAGLFQSPSKYNPFRHPELAKQRQLHVLRSMLDSGYISQQEFESISTRKLVYNPYKFLNNQLAPYFVDYIKEETQKILGTKLEGKGYKIYTTLDSEKQRQAQLSIDSLDSLVTEILKKPDIAQPYLDDMQAGLISIDPRTGAIEAMIGGRNFESSQFNVTTSALRASGSLFKPVIYSLALLKGKKWSDLMLVSPISLGGYSPKNASSSFLSETTLMKAFYNSINTQAVELGSSLGLDEVIAFAQKLGIKTPLKHEFGTFIGSSEISFFDVLRLYQVFSNQGYNTAIYGISKILDSKDNVIYDVSQDPLRSTHSTVLDSTTAFLMQEGLKNVVKYGTARRLSEYSGYVAGKTGTTNDSKDNWFCGYTQDLLSLVWVGAKNPLPPQLSGSSLAIPIWKTYISPFIKTKLNTQPPADLVSYKINPTYGNISDQGITMYFKQDNEPETRKSSFEYIDSVSGKYRGMFEDM